VTGLPTVSVIVPVKDDERLALCLLALSRQEYPAALVDVIVVDNGSRVSPRAVVDRFPTARLLFEPQAGSYAARNTGLAAATGDVIAFTDADCIPAPTWLAAAASALRDGADIVAGHVEVFAQDPRRPRPVEAYEVVHGFPQEAYVRRGGCATANLVTTRALFDRVGPFLGTLRSGGDIEWTRRATNRGASLRYVPEAQVRHPARRECREVYRKYLRVQAGVRDKALLAGHPPSPRWPGPTELRPPLGAVRRARRAPLPSRTARLSYVVGEVLHRYLAAAAMLQLARRARTSGTRTRTAGAAPAAR
jgi:glycosyltransferase involved in cell wall biosynthesis